MNYKKEEPRLANDAHCLLQEALNAIENEENPNDEIERSLEILEEIREKLS